MKRVSKILFKDWETIKIEKVIVHLAAFWWDLLGRQVCQAFEKQFY